MKVVFTAHAVSRLRQILAYIAADSPANAVSMVERIIARAETLDSQSFRGRRVPEYYVARHRSFAELAREHYAAIDDDPI